MHEKPLLPKQKSIKLFDYITAVVFFLIISFIFVVVWEQYNQNAVYKAELQKYKQLERRQAEEITKYKKEVIQYIHSIDSGYDIDSSGAIPVIISVSKNRDAKAQYIGSEMSYSYTVNGTRVNNGTTMRINLFKEIVFQTEIREDDAASDDVGREKTSQTYTFLDINKGIQLKQTVNVRERYGRDAGHVDIYNVEYTIMPTQTLKLSVSQREHFPQYPIMPSEPQKKEYKMSIFETIESIAAVRTGIIIIFILFAVGFMIYVYKIRQENAKKMSQYKRSLDEYEAEKESFAHSLAGKTIREVAGVPDFVFFTKDDLPYTIGDERKYGAFTVYVAPSGNCFHIEKLCCRSAGVRHVHMYRASQRYRPCNLCAKNYIIEKPSWDMKYLELKEKCKHYEIPVVEITPEEKYINAEM